MGNDPWGNAFQDPEIFLISARVSLRQLPGNSSKRPVVEACLALFPVQPHLRNIGKA
jgi:hypothetical protein